MRCRRDLGALALLLVLELAGLLLFAKGFFPYKKSIPGFATDTPRLDRAPQYDRLVLMVIDALRNDFVFGNGSGMAYTQSLLRSGAAVGFTAKAEAPTVTMPRIKALMTGTVPGFLDAVLNIAESDTSSSLEHQDNLLWQLNRRGQRINMFGDDTWLRLFPGLFARTDGTSSFFVTDTVEVDANVTRHIDAGELERDDWDAVILHYLGLDHIGHLAGPHSPLMEPKQREMDSVVERIHKTIQRQDEELGRRSLLVVLGDHAMNEIGNHGGNSKLEISTAFVFIGNGEPAPPLHDVATLMDREVPQASLVPTLALLFGVPIPKNNLGLPIRELLNMYEDHERLALVQSAAKQIFGVLRANERSVSEPSAAEAPHSCDGAGATTAALQCRYEQALAAHGQQRDAAEVESLYYAFMEQASSHLSRTFSGYGLQAMSLGIVLMAMAVVGLALMLQRDGGNGSGIIHWKSRRLTVGIPAVAMWATYLVSMLSSSLIEEEHQFWYFWVQTLLALRLMTASRGGAARTLAQMAVFRVVRAWNQTGQYWAGEPDIRRFLSRPENAQLMWTLAVGAVLLVSIFAEVVHRGRACAAGSWAWWYSRAFRGLLGYASLCVLVYHLERGQGWQAAAVPRWVQGLVRAAVPGDLATLARAVYMVTGGQALLGCVQRWVAPRSARAAPLDVLLGAMPLFLLLARPHNFAAFGLFFAILGLFLWRPAATACSAATVVPSSLRPSRVLTMFALVHASFFALGNSNSLASVDLSNAYAGISRYSEGLVGILVFLGSWAGPLWWALALLAAGGRSEKARGRAGALVVAGHFWQASALLTISVVATLLREHLFVWSVFSPRYLYQAAWVGGFYVGGGSVLAGLAAAAGS
ncbi:major facilitator super transporter protein [Coemansia sp. RSA 552]|nr:major facilitator super transporter protein [Coemansia sp. RSA 552]